MPSTVIFKECGTGGSFGYLSLICMMKMATIKQPLSNPNQKRVQKIDSFKRSNVGCIRAVVVPLDLHILALIFGADLFTDSELPNFMTGSFRIFHGVDTVPTT